MTIRQLFTWRNAPIWLPALVLVRDILAWQYIFSFEPGITQEAVFRGKLFMLPGSLIAGGLVPLAINLAIGVGIGFLLRLSARTNVG